MKTSILVGAAGLTLGLCAGGLFVGRARAQAPQPYGYPPPAAIAAPALPRYQYMCLTKLDQRMYVPEVQSKLNELGAQGWRLMENRMVGPTQNAWGAYSDVYCFERRY
jgi:hypothetical protein